MYVYIADRRIRDAVALMGYQSTEVERATKFLTDGGEWPDGVAGEIVRAIASLGADVLTQSLDSETFDEDVDPKSWTRG